MIIVAKTQVDLTTLFRCIEEYTGRADKKTGENNINTLLKSINNDSLIRHIFYTFMTCIHDHVMFDIYESLDLELITLDKTINPKIVLISGSLEQWKNAIVTGCNLNNKPELNTLLTSAYSKFKNSENLGYLWSDYKTNTKNQQLKFLELK